MRELNCICLHMGQVNGIRNWSMPPHRHDHFSELIVVIAGQIETQINNQTLVGNTGDVLLYPRGLTHSERSIGRIPLQTLFFAWDQLDLDVQTLPLLQHDRAGRIQTLAHWMIERRLSRNAEADPLMNHLLRAIVCAYTQSGQHQENEMVTRVKQHVMKNLPKQIRLDDLAAVACLSRYHFVRRFRKLTGVSPMRFVRDCRVDAARTLVLTSDLPMRTVAERVGFTDRFQLSRVFHRQTGQIASSLRKSTR